MNLFVNNPTMDILIDVIITTNKNSFRKMIIFCRIIFPFVPLFFGFYLKEHISVYFEIYRSLLKDGLSELFYRNVEQLSSNHLHFH